MTQTTNEREAFEAWHKKEYRNLNYATHNGRYLNARIDLDWGIWQAALSSQEQGQAVALMDSVGVCTISLHMVKQLESRLGSGGFPYHLWPTKLYLHPPKQPLAVPSGWKLVPIEPSLEAISEAWLLANRTLGAVTHPMLRKIYEILTTPPESE